MQERPKKKYVEKQPPDKNTNNYEQKQQKDNSYKPKDSYKRKETYTDSYKPKENYKDNYKPKETYKQKQNKKDYYQRPKFVQRNSSHTEDFSCLICSENIGKKDFIWTCSCCCQSMHLSCIKKWINNVNKDKKKNQILFNWTCPQCKFQYNQPMPKYYCYCGKFLNPQYERDVQAHSCGQICGRKRGPFCPHPCPQLCHKGKCQPCQFQGVLMNCQCGKSSRMVKCSEQRQVFQCGKKCEKILNCHKHKCERNCHHGNCVPCKKKHLARCFCQKNQDVVDCIQNSYSCQQFCEKVLSCGFHKCLQKCHQGQCKDCQKTPQLQKTCSCGRNTIFLLTGDQNFRKTCSDPIPTCGMPCKKTLQCGHQCPRSCHQGNCPDCKINIQQNCTCGLTNRKIQCFKAHSHKELFRCDNVCKKKRNCGQHSCNTVCCKFRNSPIIEDHLCQLTCNKMINCGKHTCGQTCHMGLCKKCPVIYSQPQYCPCGSTSIKPPIICGTIVPQCENTCNKDLECGHKCLKLCHYGPCQCFQQVHVKCRCGKQDIKTTCGRETLCMNKCPQLLECGHKCNLQCHKGTCKQAHKNQPCRKPCQRARKDCGHICSQLCHPDKKCQSYACQAQIFIKCECGHRQTVILCGMTQDKKMKKQIKCNKKCQNLKRFDILYKGKQIYYPGNMVHFALKNFGYIQNLQTKLCKFILQSEEPFIQIEFKFSDNQSKLILHNLFQNHYHLNTHFYRHKKFSSFTLMQTQNTMIPKPTLNQYIKQVEKGEVKRANLPFQYTISFQSDNRDKTDIVLRTLKPLIHKYYLQRKQKTILVHFWSKQDGYKAFAALQNQNSSYDFKGEQKIQNQQEIEVIDESEIIQKEQTPIEVKEETQVKSQEHNTQVKLQAILQKIQQTAKNEQNQNQIQNKNVQLIKQQQTKKQIPIVHVKKVLTKPSGKIILKKSNLVFQARQYPQAKQNVQDIYGVDQDQLYHEKVNWDKFVQQIKVKNFGPQASEWRIRSLLIVNSFHPVQENIYFELFQKLLKMYEKDKQKTSRILQIQKLDVKSVKSQMEKDAIYLSDHQPQMLGYLLLFNYLAIDKISIQLTQDQLNTQQVTQCQQILHAIEHNNFQEFYQIFKSAHYVLSCAMVPFVHIIRENTIQLLEKKQTLSVKDFYKFLLFQSEDQLIDYWRQCGLVVEASYSKSKKLEVYKLKDFEVKQKFKSNNFIGRQIYCKRDKKYFLLEPEELVQQQYMTRSFFAFGDFKESVSPKYMLSLVKSLKYSQ